jgi:DNA-binding transcriptional MerR regulator
MRSSELAGLADVTVRTLRHYHQVGVLPEPRRTSNGYRVYGAGDLIRLLRIKRLTALGVPLEKVEPMLAEADSEISHTVLQELDDELAHRITVLSQQRELLASLRDSRAEADLPAVVGRYLTQLDGFAVPAPLRATERDHALLLHHLLGAEVAEPLLSRFSADLGDQAELVAHVIEAFGALTDDSNEHDIAQVTEILIRLLAPIVTDLPDEARHHRHSSELVTSLQESSLNEVQREVIQRVGRELAGPALEGGARPGH